MPLHSGQPSCCGPWSEVAWHCRALCSECRVFVWYPVLLSVPAKASESDIDENPPPLRGRGLQGVLSGEQSTFYPLLWIPCASPHWRVGLRLLWSPAASGWVRWRTHNHRSLFLSVGGAFAKLPLWGTLGSFDADKPNNIFFPLFRFVPLN